MPFRFLTNNSQRTRRDVATRLQRLGVEVEEEHIFTCAMATARFLANQKPNGTAFVIGEGGLLTALHNNGYAIVDRDPDFVVVGEGRTFNAEMLETALNMILGGARLVATNPDPTCPTATGTRPGCGAIVAMLESASGIKAFSVGKPSPVMLRAAQGTGADDRPNHRHRRHDGYGHFGRSATGLQNRPGAEWRHEPHGFDPLRLSARQGCRIDRRFASRPTHAGIFLLSLLLSSQ